MSIAVQAQAAMSEPGPWLRLLANWGLGLSEAGCALPVEFRGQCPLRPVLARLAGQDVAKGRGADDRR